MEERLLTDACFGRNQTLLYLIIIIIIIKKKNHSVVGLAHTDHAPPSHLMSSMSPSKLHEGQSEDMTCGPRIVSYHFTFYIFKW